MEPEKYKIGFSNEYYTLWVDIGDTLIFKKNISKDINKVKELYPDIEIDKSLHGYIYQKIETFKPQDINPEIFQFGKYSGNYIADCYDFTYIIWYYDTVKNFDDSKYDSHLLTLKLHLTKNNYYYINDKWLSHDEFTAYNNQQIINQRCIELYKSCKPFVVTIKENPDKDGYIKLPNVGFLKFSEVKEFSYNGFEYYLPVINGKSKRLKNKVVIIEKYTFDENKVTVNVKKLTIHKS